ncbi:type IV pilin-like G/H family protein [Synechocystis sp. PCC 7509]|uniref:type IV pilin-like G/H family protein n=1 Tax=Synechocystis sp. PCC 7509 TaxID=927677 RepID=UPI0002ABC6EE|nr:type IV pilin-like G/H family protein [Synechocystis sp. PCC 7509]
MLFEVGKLLVTGNESHTPPNGHTQMKTELQAKYIQFLNNKKNKDGNKGFTLIELLVVIIIIGILAAIALPNFLSQTAKAKQSEAKNTISSVNSAQTAYRQDKAVFAGGTNGMAALALGLPTTTANYSYTFGAAASDLVAITAAKTDAALKAYTGGSARYTDATVSESIINSVICESKTTTVDATTPTGGTTVKATCNTANAVELGQP